MSRLDRHIADVQRRLTLHAFVRECVRAVLVVAAAAMVVTIVGRVSGFALPVGGVWVLAFAGAGLVYSIVTAARNRPTAMVAAAAIDQRLGLNEKFSTALFARPMDDPFAQAAVRDAEKTADNVSLSKQFPFQFPPLTGWALAAVVAFVLTAWLLRPLDLFGHRARMQEQIAQAKKVDQAKHDVQDAITKVQTIAKAMPGDEHVLLAKKDLQALLDKPMTDPEQVKRTAAQTLGSLDQQIQQQINQSKQVAAAESQQKMLASLPSPDTHETGPVADAHRDLAKGDTAKAMTELQKAVDQFNKMDPAEQKKAAAQMQQLAQQLQQMANNPQAQKQLQQQLQQMGASPDQAKQMQQMLQQAAAGDKQAQKQLQQMQQQLSQQLNNGKGPTTAQQQAMQGLMKQMQSQASAQSQAQQMSQSAQQMAQAMQQASQGQQQQNGQGKQNPQAGNSQQQMAQASQSMQQQMQQMQAIANDAAQQQAAQEASQQAAQDAADQANGDSEGGQSGNGKPGGKPGNQKNNGGGQGKWAAGDPNAAKGQGGQGGPGKGAGGNTGVAEAPFDVKKEIAPVQSIDTGKLLATPFVKAGTVRGESHANIQQAVESAQREATDDVDTDAISGDAKQAVKGYFGQLAGDGK